MWKQNAALSEKKKKKNFDWDKASLLCDLEEMQEDLDRILMVN